MRRIALLVALSAVLALALAACGDEAVVEPQIVEVEKEIIVEKEVVKEVEVEVVVEKEVIKEVKVPGETIVVTKEVQIQKFREAPMLAQLVAAGKLPPSGGAVAGQVGRHGDTGNR